MNRWIIVSVAIHAVVGIFMLAFAGEPTPRRLDLSPPEIQAMLEPDTGAEDAEPDADDESSEEELEPAPTPPPPDLPEPKPTQKLVIPAETPKPPVVKPTAKPTARPAARPTARPAARPTAKPKQDDAREKLLQRIRERRKEFNTRTSKAERTLNTTTSGTARTGSRVDPGTLKRYQDTYLAKVDRALRRNWTIPARQGTELRSALITITIEQTGRISNAAWKRRSGDATFDNSILEAIRRAEPEPIPKDLGKTRLAVTVEFKDRS